MALPLKWDIEYLQSEDLLYIKTKGTMTRETANLMLQDIVAAADSHHCDRQIVDHRQTRFAFSLTEYYERPEVNREIGMKFKWKIAMVFHELNQDTEFMETVFRNRGYNFHQFDDIDKAKEWVLSPS